MYLKVMANLPPPLSFSNSKIYGHYTVLAMGMVTIGDNLALTPADNPERGAAWFLLMLALDDFVEVQDVEVNGNRIYSDVTMTMVTDGEVWYPVDTYAAPMVLGEASVHRPPPQAIVKKLCRDFVRALEISK